MRLIFLAILFFVSANLLVSQTSETYEGKTVNVTDENNMKQGLWIKLNKDKTKKAEEGTYKDNKKEGVWKEYFENGNLKSEITFVSNKPDGYAKLYYESGKLSEEGIWKGTKWVGSYKYYHENGKPKYEFSYTDDGKRTGKQKYYHENGKLQIEGEWKEGKEAGVIKEYHADGSLKSEKNYNDGQLDESSVKNYAQGESKVKAEEKTVTENKKTEVKTETKTEEKKENKDVKVSTNPTNVSDYKAYLSELSKKYPEGVTTENYKENNNDVTRIIVVRKSNANEYKKVKTTWGQVFYYKNGQSISVSIFQLETKP